MGMNRIAAAVVAGALSVSALVIGATAVAGTAGADPWKCESCGYPFPKIPGPDDVPFVEVSGWGQVPGAGNLIPWGHLPEGWH
jgi:hypothetical protein